MAGKKIHYIDTRIVFLQVVVVITLALVGIVYWRWSEITKVEFISPEYKSSLTMKENRQVKKIVKGLDKAKVISGSRPAERFKLKLYSKKEVRSYIFSEKGSVFDVKKGTLLILPEDLREELGEVIQELKLRSPYGELINWNEVRRFFTIGKKAIVVDLDTGKRFNVERRAGYNHAEVLPLTPGDRKTIQDLYGGKWKWKRRAVVVQIDGQKVAASLTGMPHGKGGESSLFDLRFPLGMDKKDGDSLSYRVMYNKAAGQLVKMLQEATPGETILIMFTALDQGDWSTVRMMLTSNSPIKGDEERKLIGVTVFNISQTDKLSYKLKVSVNFLEGPYNERMELKVRLKKNQKLGYYQTEPEFLVRLTNL